MFRCLKCGENCKNVDIYMNHLRSDHLICNDVKDFACHYCYFRMYFRSYKRHLLNKHRHLNEDNNEVEEEVNIDENSMIATEIDTPIDFYPNIDENLDMNEEYSSDDNDMENITFDEASNALFNEIDMFYLELQEKMDIPRKFVDEIYDQTVELIKKSLTIYGDLFGLSNAANKEMQESLEKQYKTRKSPYLRHKYWNNDVNKLDIVTRTLNCRTEVISKNGRTELITKKQKVSGMSFSSTLNLILNKEGIHDSLILPSERNDNNVLSHPFDGTRSKELVKVSS